MSGSDWPLLEGRVQAAAAQGGRAGQVRLLAVSKSQPDEKLVAAMQDGCRLFGENYVQEFLGKLERLPQRPEIKDLWNAVEWHFIGHLQSNKVKSILPYVSLIHSVDRVSLVEAIERHAKALGKKQAILLEVNLGDEASKSGVAPAELEGLARAAIACPHIELKGLMAIPPALSQEEARPYFQELRRLRDTLAESIGQPLPELSMGMSADYDVAIAEGATLVRIGTALFGARAPRAQQ